MTSVIHSERLELVPMTTAFLRACLNDDVVEASRLLGSQVPSEWLQEKALMQLRLGQLENDPELEPWLLRALVERETRGMVGHIGCHGRPGADYLADIAPGGLEFGYTIFEVYRRQGYAREACGALLDWAEREHGVRRFVLSISPDNAPSRRIAEHFGFRVVTTHQDPEDGPEDVYVRVL